METDRPRTDARRAAVMGHERDGSRLDRLGWEGWMLTGVVAGITGSVLVIALVLPYLSPVVIAVVLAAVLQPAVERMCGRGLGRGLAAILAALAVLAVLALVVVVVALGLRGQSAEWTAAAGSAGRRLRESLGVDPVTPLVNVSQHRELLLGAAGLVVKGAVAGLVVLIGVLVGIYVLFFLLKDGPAMGGAIVRRLPVPATTGWELLNGAGFLLRRYMVGTTVVAAMDTAVITLGALVLRLPLLVVIALVTFVAAFVPYLGAWLSAIFAIVVALGSGGVTAAVWMLVIILITQNVLENLLRPYAFGVALNVHPLAVLGATVVGGILGGFIGVFIAPPLAAILLSWRRTLSAVPAARRP